MARESDLYFVDVYVPNEGEPESALELAILRVGSEHEKPQVYVHTYLKPTNYNISRIRWVDAYEYKISRALIEHNNWPSIHDIIQEDYLKGKNVVCFCNTLEPVQTLTKNSHFTYSILSSWQDIFARKDDAFNINHFTNMLEYMGLPIEDSSNTRYTPLIKRLYAQIAIWFYLYHCGMSKVTPEYGDYSLALTEYWPLQSVPEPWYDTNLTELGEIDAESLKDYFSERLADYIDWSNILVYRHDWVFRRERNCNVKLVELDSMIQFIFSRVFNLSSRILVLTYYALYNNKIEYAQTIALHRGLYSDLPQAVREDFGSFMTAHLDDFLSANEKHSIISALTEQVVQAKAAKNNELVSYEDFRKYAQDANYEFGEISIPSNKNIQCFVEVRCKGDVIYRLFKIAGDEQERQECMNAINDKLNDLIVEARDPFADCWTSPSLRQWVEYITGFKWRYLSRAPRPNDSESLVKTRQAIRDIITSKSQNYYKSYIKNLKSTVAIINSIEVGQKTTLEFEFQGIKYNFILDFTGNSSGFLKRIFNRNR